MDYDEIVTSPYHGTIKAIPIQENAKITEWQPLFIIQTLDGENKTIAIGISGRVQSIEVQEGDEVIPGMVLTYIREEPILM